MNPLRRLRRELPTRSASAVVEVIKRSNGLPVAEIAARLRLSYMGVKNHCVTLEKSGHLVSRNQHQAAGRPQCIYRLTAKGQHLFPTVDHGMAISLLHEARKLFGTSAAEKLLFLHSQSELADFTAKLAALTDPSERLARLAALRDEAGHMAGVEDGCLVESHCPHEALHEAFPSTISLEESLISKLLKYPVKRLRESHDAHYQIRFAPLFASESRGEKQGVEFGSEGGAVGVGMGGRQEPSVRAGEHGGNFLKA